MKTIAMFVFYMLFFAQAIGQVPVAVESVIHLKTSVTENPPSISFQWNEIPGNYEVNIYRKGYSSEKWNKIHTTPAGFVEFTDDMVQKGVKYEYKIASVKSVSSFPTETYVTAGINCPEVEYRGKLILLVDSLIIEPLKFEISRLEKDLIGDGWEIIRKDISRRSSVKQVKDSIRKMYHSDVLNVKTLFLLGHIPVPYSGETAFDGHEDHEGAWPADLYYGSMNETLWTDLTVNNTKSRNSENHNIPGDGKFDRSKLDNNQTIELAIGRVDFYNLPAFSQLEIELMRNYLDKNHNYRHKLNHPNMQALIDDNLEPLPVKDLEGNIVSYELMAVSGWRNFTALLNFENVKAGKVFQDVLENSYLWTYGCGWGNDTLCKGVGTSTYFVNFEPKTVFTVFYGSWFGDWNIKNNFLRSALASNGWILTSCWAGRPHYVFHTMSMGETIGECIRKTQNNYNTYYLGPTDFRKAIHISLMGDPTLQMHLVSPVQNLISENSGDAIYLSWNAPEGEFIGYYVYKLNTATDKYEKLNKKFTVDRYYTDDSPEYGNNTYMVRALQLTKSASGSYYNLSQGVYTEISTNTTSISHPKDNVFIYPNPTSNFITIETDIPDIYNIEITSTNGQLLLNKVLVGREIQLDLSPYKSGVYFISIQSKDLTMTGKIMKL